MLQYDEEKLIPGELETAEKKAEEIEGQIQAWHEKMIESGETASYTDHAYVGITPHITGKFDINTTWGLNDYYHEDVKLNDMLKKLGDTFNYTLKYDEEWLILGELEYAEQKASDIYSKVQKYHDDFKEDKWGTRVMSIDIRLTQNITGEYKVKIPEKTWDIEDIDASDEMLLDWFQDVIAPIDPPKVFRPPEGDIRHSLPEWSDALLPDESLTEIMMLRSKWYQALQAAEGLDGQDARWQRDELNMDEVEFDKVLKSLIKKLDTKGKYLTLSAKEEMLASILADNYKRFSYYNQYACYEPWRFPFEMREEDIISALREAYQTASIRSRSKMPTAADISNIKGYPESYELLYQGKAGDMFIRFLFDFKNMRIVTAYPVFKEERRHRFDDLYYYNKKIGRFYYDYKGFYNF